MSKTVKDSYKKYRWFFTSSGKLVIGGKSAAQNDELLQELKNANNNFIVMHTSEPGSPFSIIISDIKKVTKPDEEETAIFTGCFSRAWRAGKKKTKVDIFRLSQLYKLPQMKIGTWGVSQPIQHREVELKLALTYQKEVLRAVPLKTAKKNMLLKIAPGKIDKTEMLPKFQIELNKSLATEEILSALPAGGVAIIK